MKQQRVFNLPIHLMSDYSNWLLERINQNQYTHVVTLNAEMAMMCQENPELEQIIQKADLVIPDGAGIIFYLWRQGKRHKRCAGIELASALVEKLGKQGDDFPICFYGGAPGIAEKAAKYWQEKIPQISLIHNHGFLSEEQQQEWLEILQAQQPKLILVGLGVPRQELWINQHSYICPHSVWIGVGGSFDIWSGNKTRAPQWLRDNYLEWLYRLYQEPWRWRRMLVLPKFFIRTLFSDPN
jgi:N-acetylglucosaminyldiphosphoundecaprenol N-acetyl-beta-D-mannosaminyltransferase